MAKKQSRVRAQAERVYELTDQLQVQLRTLETGRLPVHTVIQPSNGGADGDIMAIAFIVMMQAAQSAQEDLKAIMEQVKAINAAKTKLCGLMDSKKKKRHPRSGALDFESVFYLVATVYAKDLDEQADELFGQLDGMSEMGEMQSLKLQMAMDRMSKMMSTLSNLLKKISDTSSQITQNLK